jgi:hypothetical protein
MGSDDRKGSPDNLIKENLQRVFKEKASEELPPDLVALLAQLRDQDDNNDNT